MRGRNGAELLEQRFKAAVSRAVKRQNLVFLHEKLLLGCERANSERGKPILIEQLSVSVQDQGELLFGHAVQIPHLVGFRVRMDGEEQRLLQLRIKRADKIRQLFKAEVAGQGVAVPLVLLGQLFGEGDGNARGGLKHGGYSFLSIK